MEETFIFYMPSDFPRDDVVKIGRFLSESGSLVPSFIPAPVGLLNIEALVYAKEVDGIDIQILPDRNLASRIALVAKQGIQREIDYSTKIAAHTMAFAQAMNLLFEPSISFHELAYNHGNEVANDELAWFRVADNAGALNWIGLALGRQKSLNAEATPIIGTADLAYPLRRWVRNYIVALKIAELELEESAPIEKARRLLTWMFEDFIFAGPAALFSTMFFSPNAARRRMIKRLRSPDRSKAIEGVKNAAWDITYMSDIAERTARGEEEKKRYIFATADKNLATIAPLIFLAEDSWTLAEKLRAWWPRSDAEKIAETMFDIRDKIDAFPHPRKKEVPPTFLDDCISRGEQIVLSWKPNS